MQPALNACTKGREWHPCTLTCPAHQAKHPRNTATTGCAKSRGCPGVEKLLSRTRQASNAHGRATKQTRLTAYTGWKAQPSAGARLRRHRAVGRVGRCKGRTKCNLSANCTPSPQCAQRCEPALSGPHPSYPRSPPRAVSRRSKRACTHIDINCKLSLGFDAIKLLSQSESSSVELCSKFHTGSIFSVCVECRCRRGGHRVRRWQVLTRVLQACAGILVHSSRRAAQLRVASGHCKLLVSVPPSLPLFACGESGRTATQ